MCCSAVVFEYFIVVSTSLNHNTLPDSACWLWWNKTSFSEKASRVIIQTISEVHRQDISKHSILDNLSPKL